MECTCWHRSSPTIAKISDKMMLEMMGLMLIKSMQPEVLWWRVRAKANCSHLTGTNRSSISGRERQGGWLPGPTCHCSPQGCLAFSHKERVQEAMHPSHVFLHTKQPLWYICLLRNNHTTDAPVCVLFLAIPPCAISFLLYNTPACISLAVHSSLQKVSTYRTSLNESLGS